MSIPSSSDDYMLPCGGCQIHPVRVRGQKVPKLQVDLNKTRLNSLCCIHNFLVQTWISQIELSVSSFKSENVNKTHVFWEGWYLNIFWCLGKCIFHCGWNHKLFDAYVRCYSFSDMGKWWHELCHLERWLSSLGNISYVWSSRPSLLVGWWILI